jgi:hypothetical protein
MDEGQMETKRAAGGEAKFLAIEHDVALILAETASGADAYPKLLETIATALGWEFVSSVSSCWAILTAAGFERIRPSSKASAKSA